MNLKNWKKISYSLSALGPVFFTAQRVRPALHSPPRPHPSPGPGPSRGCWPSSRARGSVPHRAADEWVPPVSDRLPFPFFFLRLFPSTNTAFLSLTDSVIRIRLQSPSLPYLATPSGYKTEPRDSPLLIEPLRP
jgi:hypothetical protein